MAFAADSRPALVAAPVATLSPVSRIEQMALTVSGAAQVVVLCAFLKDWTHGPGLSRIGLGLLFAIALLATIGPVAVWARLVRAARCDGGLAAAAAERLQPVAPALGVSLVVCYWFGHCALAGLGLALLTSSLQALIWPSGGDPTAFALMVGCGVLLLAEWTPVVRLRASTSVLAALLVAACGAWSCAYGLPLTAQHGGLELMAQPQDTFEQLSALCALLCMVTPGLCAAEALLALPEGSRRRAGAGGRLAAWALLGSVLAAVGVMVCSGHAAARAVGSGLATIDRLAPVLLTLASGTLVLRRSRRAALQSISTVESTGLLPLGLDRRVPRLVVTAATILACLLLHDASWLLAGAGLAYEIALAGSLAILAALASRPPGPTVERGISADLQMLSTDELALPRGLRRWAALAVAVWLASALLGLQAWGSQAVLIGLVVVYLGGALHHLRARRGRDSAGPNRRPIRPSIHAKLLAGMLLILALSGAGFVLAHDALEALARETAMLAGDMFTAIALLTVLVGLVLPSMIVDSLTRTAEAAERLALVSVAQLRECIDALGRGELDPRVLEVNVEPVRTPFRDEIGRIVASINRLQSEVRRAAVGLASARDNLRSSRADLFRQARHDSLTGLHNRHAFEEALTRVVGDRRAGMAGHGLLYLDLDQFKIVNDTCGHDAGDELLRQVSLLLAAQMRGNDILSRLGGDEFGVILENCTMDNAVRIGEAMLVAVRELSFGWQDRVFRVGVSIGVVHFRSGETTLTEVLSSADKACYYAKEQGRNRLHAYSPDDDELRTRSGEMQWVSRIHQALEQGRMCLFAQQILPLGAGGAEAARGAGHFELLLRMVDDQGELVPPMAFIPAAERFGVMTLLDRWVIRSALERLGELVRAGGIENTPKLALNLSGASITDESFLEYVKEQFRMSRAPCELVWFEITETSAIANLRKAKRFISELRGLGCRFGLDDFGAGMSSFGYLRQLDVDFLKIDGAFVKDMADDPIDRAMVESINRIGQLMGLETIAEFVEDVRVIALLQAMGVDMVQGNGVAAPVPFLVDERVAHRARERAPQVS